MNAGVRGVHGLHGLHGLLGTGYTRSSHGDTGYIGGSSMAAAGGVRRFSLLLLLFAVTWSSAVRSMVADYPPEGIIREFENISFAMCPLPRRAGPPSVRRAATRGASQGEMWG